MKGLLRGLLCLCLIQNAMAKESESFVYDGAQTIKEILLNKDVYRTYTETEEYEDTCTRQVQDGTRTECHDETRQSCQYIPESCSTSYEQVCQNNPPVCHTTQRTCQTEYEQVCTDNPDVCHTTQPSCHTENEQVCTSNPQVCETVPPVCRNVCHSTPPVCRNVCHSGPNGQICREVCSEGSEQCRDVCSGGGQHCSSGGQSCHSESHQVCSGGGQECRDGGQSCHNEARQVCSGGDEECRDGGQSCHSEPRQSCIPGHDQCTPYQEQVCADVPYYRSEDYSCTRSREVSHTELDYTLEAKVLMNFAEVAPAIGAKEKFTLSLNDTNLSIQLDSSKKLLVFADKTQDVDSHGDVRTINAKVDVSFINLAEINLAIKDGIDDMAIDQNGILSFSVGVYGSKLKFKHALKIMQSKFGKDTEILNKEIDSSLFTITNLNGKNLFSLNLVKLGVKLNNKKHKITIKSEVVLAKKPLNEADIPKLEVTKMIKIKL